MNKTIWISFWTVVLSSNLLAMPVVTNGLVAHWSGNVVGSNALDDSGNNHTGTLLNGASTTPGPQGNALSFDGSNDFISVSNSSAFDFFDFSLSVFVFTDPSTNTGERRTISRDDILTAGGDGREAYAIKTSSGAGGNNKALFGVINGGAVESIADPNELSLGWHHIVATKEGTTLKLFVDSLLVASAVGNLSGEISPESTLAIGQVDPSFNGEFFNGLMDNVSIYNRALSEGEVGLIFNEFNGVVPEPSSILLLTFAVFLIGSRKIRS